MSQSTMRFLIEIICIFTGITSDFIGVGRFRILGGGAKFRILGGGGGGGGARRAKLPAGT